MTEALLKGMEGVFIPVSNPKYSAKWYKEKLGCKLIYMENEAATLRIADESQTVICLVRTTNHQPMKFPENKYGVGKYYNFYPQNINETYRKLVDRGVKVNPIGGEGTMKYFTFFDPDGNPLGACESI